MARLAPFRDETLRNQTEMRLRLNDLVTRVNETATQVQARRIPNVRAGQQITISAPGFTVGAILLGGVQRIDDGAAPSAAPWASWSQQTDGRILVTVNGLAAAPALYSVSLVLLEAWSATT